MRARLSETVTPFNSGLQMQGPLSPLDLSTEQGRARLRRPAPAFEPKFHLPTRRELDLPLIGGSALFGIGWGLSGFCPGGAIPALGSGSPAPFIFVASMIGGMLAANALRSFTARRAAA